MFKFVAETMQREMPAGWSESYFERVVGQWQGDLNEPEELLLEAHDLLF